MRSLAVEGLVESSESTEENVFASLTAIVPESLGSRVDSSSKLVFLRDFCQISTSRHFWILLMVFSKLMPSRHCSHSGSTRYIDDDRFEDVASQTCIFWETFLVGVHRV